MPSQHTASTQTEGQIPLREEPKNRWWHTATFAYITAFSIVATTVSLLLTLFVMRPQLAPSFGAQMDHVDPYSSVFLIANSGDMTAHGTRVMCANDFILFESGNNVKTPSITTSAMRSTVDIPAHGTTAVKCPELARLFLGPSNDPPGHQKRTVVVGDPRSFKGESGFTEDKLKAVELRMGIEFRYPYLPFLSQTVWKLSGQWNSERRWGWIIVSHSK